jgi:hypothetical protein
VTTAPREARRAVWFGVSRVALGETAADADDAAAVAISSAAAAAVWRWDNGLLLRV